MRKPWMLIPVMLVSGLWFASQVIAAKAAEGSEYVGTWTGTWEGGGTGKFDLTLTAGADGAIGGSVSVGTDGGDYNANLKAVKFAGNKLTATYDYPLDAQGEIAMTATFAKTDATGTWALGPKGEAATNSMANGTFTVKKK